MDVDRKRLAAIVFQDPKALAALNAIVHPVIMKEIADRLERLGDTDTIVVLDAALIVELGLAGGLDYTIVVVADERTRVDRLRASRGMTHQEIFNRIAAQAPTEELVARADAVVTNDGSLEKLAAEADRIYAVLDDKRRRS